MNKKQISMKCTICGKESDVLAEGKCVSCYEQSLVGAMPTVAETPVQTQNASIQRETRPVSGMVGDPHIQLPLDQPISAKAIKPKRSIVKYVMKYGALAVFALTIGSAITYWQLYVNVTDEPIEAVDLSSLGQTRVTTTTTTHKAEETTSSDEAAIDDVPTDVPAVAEEPDTASGATTEAACDNQGTGPKEDEDCDGILNALEPKFHTDPTKADTDGDGLDDHEELVTYHTDPTKEDTDGDGFNDKLEAEGGTATDPTRTPSAAPVAEPVEDRADGEETASM